MVTIIKLSLGVVLFLATAFGVWVGVVTEEFSKTKRITIAVSSVVIGLGLICAVQSFNEVPANHVGVKYSRISGTSETTLGEGVHMLIPFIEKVTLIDTKVQEEVVNDISVQTKDAQFLTVDFNVKFAVNKGNAFKVFSRYGTIDGLKSSVISNYGQKALELVITEYNIIEVLGEKKSEVYTLASEVLAEMLEDEGVTLTQLTIIDMDAGEAIEKAISDEAVAKKAVETAEQDRLKAEKEAETAIIKAEASAETRIIEAEAMAKSNELLNEELSDEILTKTFIEKWDGVMPTVYGSGDSILDISAIME